MDATTLADLCIKDLENVTRVCTIDTFMEAFLSPENALDYAAILEELRDAGYYGELEGASHSRWKGFSTGPQPDGSSSNIIPFRDACNAIRRISIAKARKNIAVQGDQVSYFDGMWLDENLGSPGEHNADNITKPRPDISFLFGSSEDCNRLKHLVQLEPSTSNESDVDDLKQMESSADDKEIQSRRQFVCWLRTLLVSEVRDRRNLMRPDVVQLGTHMRYMLREQQDRRFVFGMILLHDQLTLWYCDRSGLLGAEDFIDIHEDPLMFIRVISTFALMPAEDFGYDMTMKLLIENGKDFRYMYSHSSELRIDDLPTNRADLHWEIDLGIKMYRTIKHISFNDLDVMCGRATLVWLAALVPPDIHRSGLSEDGGEKSQLVVIKQSWRKADSPSEYELYQITYPDPAELEQRVIQDWDDPSSRTLDGLRKGIETFSIVPNFGPAPDGLVYIPPFNLYSRRLRVEGRYSTNRVLNRLVFPHYGWPLEKFKDLRELLNVFKGVLQDYEDLYRKGICHRDVNVGNITIDYVTGRGRLIDLDNSMLDPTYEPLTIGEYVSQKTQGVLLRFGGKFHSPIQLMNTYFSMFKSRGLENRLPDEFLQKVLLHQSQYDPLRAIPIGRDLYKECCATTIRKGPGENFLMQDCKLDITEATLIPPKFASCVMLGTFQIPIGVPGFMSHALLDIRNTKPHTAIHDMESVLWDLVYICITRAGPGGERQDIRGTQFVIPDEERRQNVSRLIHLFFDGPRKEIFATKNTLFSNPELMETHILPAFNEYFEPVKPLVMTWWKYLVLAFKPKHRWAGEIPYTYPLGTFRNALCAALDELPETVSSERELAVEADRQEQRKYIMQRIEYLTLDSEIRK